MFYMDSFRDYISTTAQNQIIENEKENGTNPSQSRKKDSAGSCNWFWLRVIVKEAVSKSKYPVETPLLLVTQPKTRDSIYMMKSILLWDITPRNPLEAVWSLEGIYCIHNQDWRISQASRQEGGR
jgi:hypothetical protein